MGAWTANACGVPVLAARLAGAAEAVEEGVSGMFVEKPTVKKIGFALERFLSGKVSFDSVKCRNFAKKFSWARVVDRALAYYNKNQYYKAYWKVNNTCNLNCEYCFYEAHKEHPLVGKYGIEHIVESFDKTGISWAIEIDGGEPFCYPNFIELLRKLTITHYIIIVTNLTHPLIKDFAKTIRPERVKLIKASLHVKELERLNKTDDYIRNFCLLKEQGFNLKALYVCYPPLLGRIEKDYNFFKSKGVIFESKIFRGIYDGKDYPESYTAQEKEIIRKFLPQDSDEAKFLDRKLSFKGRHCQAGSHLIDINEAGRVSPCISAKVFKQIYLGNIFESTMKLGDRMRVCTFRYCRCPYEGIEFAKQQKATPLGYFWQKVVDEIKRLKSAKLRSYYYKFVNSLNRIRIFLEYGKLCILRYLHAEPSSPMRLAGNLVHFGNFSLLVKLFKDIFVDRVYFCDLGDYPVIIDAGANIGIATLFFKQKYPNSRIIAFEPNPDSFDCLKKNIERNQIKDVELYNAALGDHEGSIPFYLSTDMATAALEGSAIKEHVEYFHKNKGKTIEINIPCYKLSKFIDGRIDLLKLDVKGSEGKIISELQDKLREINNIVMEYHYIFMFSKNSLLSIISILEENSHLYQILKKEKSRGLKKDVDYIIRSRKI